LNRQSTNSTRLPEPMTSLSSITNDATPVALRLDLPSLISQLEQSLHAGQRALLVRDVEKFEEQTAIQVSLSKVLAESLDDWTPGEDNLRAACSRVMHLCRVQLGLLRRAQRSLRVLSNLLAGAEGTYLLAGAQADGCRTALSHEEG
jgi:hypothetical protein